LGDRVTARFQYCVSVCHPGRFFIALALMIALASGSTALSAPKVKSFYIVRTNFLGSIWNEAHARASVVSQDGGQSFVVPGGAVWAFGDTFKGSRSADGTPHFAGGAVSCSIALLGENAGTYPPAFTYFASSNGVVSPFEYFTNEPAERYRIWPLGGIHVRGRNYLYYSLIEVFGNGQWDFRGAGSGLCRSQTALGPYERLRPHGNWRIPVEPSQVIQAGGWLYLFEIKEFGEKSGVALARVRPDKIENPDAYEFYTGVGPKFSARPESASLLVENVPGQVSVAWNPYLQKYVMASSSDLDHPREIRFLVAKAPYGPWNVPVARIEVPERCQGKRVELAYCAYLHPELFRNNGRVMNLTFTPGLQDAGFDGNCEMVEIELRPP
jgi:hypothetical protein